MRKKLIVANWKLNPESPREAGELFRPILKTAATLKQTEVVVCPPVIFLPLLAGKLRAKSKIELGAQDVFWESRGAFTGEISAPMLRKSGAKYVLLGHSEKRRLVDSNSIVNRKVRAALKEGLRVILCVGEAERDKEGNFFQFIRQELLESLVGVPRRFADELVIAYEPIWAIGGSSKEADTPADFLQQSLFIKKALAPQFGREAAAKMSVLYGGSVTPKNVSGFLIGGEASGLLVGHESLRAAHFFEILKTADKL